MRFASILLAGLLATGLHAAELNPEEIPPRPTADSKDGACAAQQPVGSMVARGDDEFVSAEAYSPIVSSCTSCGPTACGFYGLDPMHCPWRSRCNMPQHMPYYAQPSTYYYLRPYNYFHIPLIQEEAQFHGATAANPYDTDLFEQVYAEYEGSPSSESLLPSP